MPVSFASLFSRVSSIDLALGQRIGLVGFVSSTVWKGWTALAHVSLVGSQPGVQIFESRIDDFPQKPMVLIEFQF
jgi:hypothetical protein